MSVPRYQKYKNSGVAWLSDVPEHWDVVQSRRYFQERKEGAREGDAQLTSSQKYGVIYQEEFMKLENQRVTQVIKGQDILKHVEPNDFVISMRSFQGGIEWCGYRGCISSAYVMLIPSKEINSRFFYYLFKSSPYIQALQSTSNLVRDGQALRYANFVQVDLPLLPYEEQEAIAAFLDRETVKIDALVAEQERLIELLKEKRQAVISHAVTKGLNPKAPMKPSGIDWLGDIPAHWDLKPLKYIASCNDEVLGENTDEGYEIEYIEISGVSANDGITEMATVKFGEAPSRARRKIKHGDIIVSTVRTYLRAISPVVNPEENWIASTGFAVIRPKSIKSDYLGYVFKSEFLISEIIARSVGISYPAINASEVMHLKIVMPPEGEQIQIADFLNEENNKANDLLSQTQKTIDLLQERRTALISAAVTGKIDVRSILSDQNKEAA